MMPDGVVLRKVRPEERRFIVNAWYMSYAKQSELRPDIIRAGENRVIESVLGNPSTKLAIACHADLPEEILAFCVWRDNTVFYTYTKKSYRRMGIATALVTNAACTTFSHDTQRGTRLAKKLGLVFDPYAVIST